MVVVYGTYNAFGVYLKPVLTDFGWSTAVTSGAFSLSMIMHGLSGIVMGRLNDRFGPRIVLSLCSLLFGLGYLLMSQISALWQLYLLYGVLIGAGASGAWVPLQSTVARWFVGKRSLMTGIIISGVGIGGLIIPPIASWLIYAYVWRASYFILGSVVLVIAILFAQFLRSDPAQIGLVPYGRNRAEKQGVKLETKALSLREAICTKQLWLICGIVFCLGFHVYAILVHIVPHAIELGTSLPTAAIILATIGGLSIAGRVILGIAADRIGSRQVFIIGFILISASLFWLSQATVEWELYLFAAAFGFGWGGCAVAQSPLAAEFFGLSSHGSIYGVLSLGFAIGASIGPFLAGYIFDITDSYQVAFLLGAALGILSLILTAVLRPIKTTEVKA